MEFWGTHRALSHITAFRWTYPNSRAQFTVKHVKNKPYSKIHGALFLCEAKLRCELSRAQGFTYLLFQSAVKLFHPLSSVLHTRQLFSESNILTLETYNNQICNKSTLPHPRQKKISKTARHGWNALLALMVRRLLSIIDYEIM